MTLFAWLALGHLVGDWLLQNDWMARGKARARLSAACLAHCLLYTASLAPVLLWQAKDARLAVALAMIFLSHWVIDWGDLARRWGRLLHQTDTETVRTVVDQTFHLGVLAVLAAWLG